MARPYVVEVLLVDDVVRAVPHYDVIDPSGVLTAVHATVLVEGDVDIPVVVEVDRPDDVQVLLVLVEESRRIETTATAVQCVDLDPVAARLRGGAVVERDRERCLA